jgi:mRNA interferase YafQ
MLAPVRSAQFKRDVSTAAKRGRDLTRLRALLESLIQQEPLTARYLDHPLRGIWKGYREAHIEPDWLLIYRIVGSELRLVRTGSHADLFKE